MTEQRHLTWVAALATLLTSLALSPLFDSRSWTVSAVVMIAVIAGVGFGSRALGVPFYVVALLQIVAAGVLLLYQFNPGDTLWYGLPTWDTIRGLNDVGLSGRSIITRSATPVPTEDGVVFLTVAGIAGVAVAVDLLAIGLRLVPLAGLPLLALYTVPVAVVPDGVPWGYFALAAGSYVGLLVAEGRDRLSHWGRTMGFSERDSAAHQFVGDVQTGPIGRLGRRIGATAVCLAVAVPVMIPGIDKGLFGGGLGTGGNGGRLVITSDPVVDLRRDLRQPDDVPIFTYETDDPTPDYWRMTTLETFDGDEWKRADDRRIPDENVAEGVLPGATGVAGDVPSQPRSTTVHMLQRFESHWLPLPYPVVNLSIDEGRWVYDSDTSDVFGIQQTTAGVDYTARSLEIDFESVQPGDDIPGDIDQFLDLPELPPLVGALADQVTTGATSAYEQATLLQAWFRSPAQFKYTLDAPEGHSANDLVAFLQDREGYCEQFAATMALMARHLGIPARVDVGFLPGSQETATSWEVTTHDAHAWPELYFENLGWVRFEPTPGSRTGTAPGWTLAVDEPEPTVTTSAPGSTAAAPSVAPTRRDVDDLGNPIVADAGFTFPTVPVLLTLAVLLLLLTPWLVRYLMTRARWRQATTAGGTVLAGWDVLRDRAADLGYTWTSADTPRSLAAVLQTEADLTGDPADALTRLARGTERARYARASDDTDDAAWVRADVDTVSTALTDAVPRSRQWRARFLPGTTRRVVHALTEKVADGLDWVEGLSDQLRIAARRRGASTSA